jgi:two-component system response regulator HydG
MNYKFSILVLDDEETIVDMLGKMLHKDFNFSGFTEVEPARKYLAGNNVDVLILDYRLKDENGLDLLEDFKRLYPEMEVIMITGFGDIDMAVRAVKSGAYHFLSKPFEQDVLKNLIKNALAKKEYAKMINGVKSEAQAKYNINNISGSSVKTKNIRELILKSQELEADVLLIGENGTGKEFTARVIHTGSRRADTPFIPFNCGTMDSDATEAELFGRATENSKPDSQRKNGIFEAAREGTVFLSDIFELPAGLKTKVTDMLKNREFHPVGNNGSGRAFGLMARVIAATHRDENEIVNSDAETVALYKALGGFPVILPPLRERIGDIKEVAEYFLRKNGEKLGRQFTGFSEDTLQKLCAYNWPGNIRHLENVIERVSILEEGSEITSKYLPPEIEESYIASRKSDITSDYRQFMKVSNDRASVQYMKSILKETGGNVTKAANIAGMKRESFHRLLKKHDINSRELR